MEKEKNVPKKTGTARTNERTKPKDGWDVCRACVYILKPLDLVPQ